VARLSLLSPARAPARPLAQVEKYAAPETCKLLIGNKSDRTDRAITEAEGAALAKELGMPLLETSARTSDNVEAAFNKMAENLIKMRCVAASAGWSWRTQRAGAARASRLPHERAAKAAPARHGAVRAHSLAGPPASCLPDAALSTVPLTPPLSSFPPQRRGREGEQQGKGLPGRRAGEKVGRLLLSDGGCGARAGAAQRRVGICEKEGNTEKGVSLSPSRRRFSPLSAVSRQRSSQWGRRCWHDWGIFVVLVRYYGAL